MKLDLNWKFENISLLGFEAGKENEMPEEAIHAGKILSAVLVKSTESENPIKFFDWAIKFYNKQVVELDKSDTELLKKFVKNSQQLSVFVKAQILNKINELDKKE